MNTRQPSEINEIPNFYWIACFFKFLCKHFRTGKPTKSRRRDHDLPAATVKIGFRGQRWKITGGVAYTYIYIYVYMFTYVHMYVLICTLVCVYIYI